MNLEKCPTLEWFSKCTQQGIPADQASLLSMFIRNLQSRLDATGSQDIQIHKLLKLMSISNQTLIEPIFTELNAFCNQKADTELTLRQVKEEREEILGQAERRSKYYIYLLLGLTSIQFVVFYWTIFHVDWLGWDIMEPLTYTVQLLNVLVAMRFYYKYRAQRGLAQIIQNNRERFINKTPSIKFRVTKLLKTEEQLEKERQYISKSIEYYRHRQKLI